VINLKTQQLIATIELKGYHDQLVVHGQMLHVVDAFNGILSFIDIGGYLPGQY